MRNFTTKVMATLHDRALAAHRDEAGAGVLEYSLVAAVISVALVAAALTFGQAAVNSATAAVNGVLP